MSKEPVSYQPVWTVNDLAEAADVDPSTVRRWLLSGRLDGYKLGRDWFIRDSVAREFLSTYENPKK